jgi:hypothetical protein
MILRDQTGKRIGTIEESYGGRKTVRDNHYRTQYRIEQGFGDRLIIRDATGKRTGSVESR